MALAFCKGLAAAQGEVLAWTHADMQTDPADALKAYDLWLEKKDKKTLIKGARKSRAVLDAFFTFGMQLATYGALRVWMSDINAQPKLFSRDFYQAYLLQHAPYDFSLDLYLLYQAKRNGFRIATIPVDFSKRHAGEAKGGGGGWRPRLKLIKRTFAYIFQLRDNLR